MSWKAKNDIRVQFKHGLWGSSVKKRKFYLGLDRSKLDILFGSER